MIFIYLLNKFIPFKTMCTGAAAAATAAVKLDFKLDTCKLVCPCYSKQPLPASDGLLRRLHLSFEASSNVNVSERPVAVGCCPPIRRTESVSALNTLQSTATTFIIKNSKMCGGARRQDKTRKSNCVGKCEGSFKFHEFLSVGAFLIFCF